MDLSRSFCRATMKGSFKCSEGKRERESARRPITQPALGTRTQRCTAGTSTGKKPFLLVSECTFINVSVRPTPPFLPDLCQGYRSWRFDIVALIFQLNNRAHRECQIPRLQLPRPYSQHHGQQSGYIPTYRDVWPHCFMRKLWMTFKKTLLQILINYHSTEAKGHSSFVIIRRIKSHPSFTWQLWVYLLSHVL